MDDDRTINAEAGQPAAPAPPLHQWGPLRLIEKVGQGSFGEVYRAFDTTLEREVALKLLRGQSTETSAQAKELLREARLMARIRHPNVVAIYGVDKHEGRIGFWSDFVKGKTLSALVREQGAFGPREAALIGIDLCRAVSAVHAACLLHRDIKTGNAMREEGGRILLMDFGLSHEAEGANYMGGTPSFMAPELFLGRPASVSSEIYALGAVLFHLLTGKLPVPAATSGEGTLPRRRTLLDERPDLPEPIARVVGTAMHPDPERRYESAGKMIAALGDAIGLGNVPTGAVVPKGSSAKYWIVAGVLAAAIAAAFLVASVRTRLTGVPGSSTSAGAHADYLRAEERMAHYYEPRAIDDAVALFEKAVKEDPRFAMAYAGLGRAYMSQFIQLRDPKFAQPAIDACSKALELDPDLAAVHVTLGMLYTETGKNDLAAQELKEALRLDARSADAYGALGELYYKQGRIADVEGMLQKAADLAPKDWRWPDRLGYYYGRTGKLEKAVEAQQRAVELAPDNARAYNNLGGALEEVNRLDEARAAFEKAIAIEPGFSRFSNLGLVLEEQGNFEQATQMYEKATGLNPSSYLAWGGLGLAYRQIPGKEDKATAAYQKAIEVGENLHKQRPNDAGLIVNLATYYAALGRKSESTPLIRQAVALAPEDSEVLYRACLGYELQHDRTDALRMAEQAFAHGFSLAAFRQKPELADLRKDPKYIAIAQKFR